MIDIKESLFECAVLLLTQGFNLSPLGQETRDIIIFLTLAGVEEAVIKEQICCRLGYFTAAELSQLRAKVERKQEDADGKA
jgi:hypothetical protein